MFEHYNDDKCVVRFNITNHGKQLSFNGEYDFDVTWPEVLDDVVKTLEASYGYSFDIDLETPSGVAGIYYSEKDNGC